MVKYTFESNNKDPVELKSRIRPVSCVKIFLLLLSTFLLGLNVFYGQYFLFYQNRTSNEFPIIMFLLITVLIIYIVSAMVNMSFSARIFVRNSVFQEDSNFYTVIIVSGLFVTIDIYFTSLQQKSNVINSFPWIVQIICSYVLAPSLLFLQITTFLCNVFLAKYAVQCKLAESEERRAKFYDLMVQAEADAGLVSVLDCYLRAAPQLIAQLAFFLQKHGADAKTNISILQLLSVIIAFVMMPWSITSFQGSLRIQQNHEVGWMAKTVYFLWHFFIMISRICSVSGAMAFWPMYTGALILIHCIGTTAWLWWTTEPTEFCGRRKSWHFLFCCVFGCVYFFYPMNLDNKPTCWKYFCFYTIMATENALSLYFWAVKENEIPQMCKPSFIAINGVMFALGVSFMIFYYTHCHPRRNNFVENVDAHENVEILNGKSLEDVI